MIIPDYVHHHFAEHPGPIRPPITCRDSSQLSVQASFMHQSVPQNDEGPYTHVEVCVIPYDGGTGVLNGDALKSVGRIPVEQVNRMIHNSGGLAV